MAAKVPVKCGTQSVTLEGDHIVGKTVGELRDIVDINSGIPYEHKIDIPADAPAVIIKMDGTQFTVDRNHRIEDGESITLEYMRAPGVKG
jgi:hypothetical protein